MTKFTESHVEEAALEWLSGHGWAVAYGLNASPDGDAPERGHCGGYFLDRPAYVGLVADFLDRGFRAVEKSS